MKLTLTKEDLDKLEAWCNGHSDHPKFEVSMDELLRLARLGLQHEKLTELFGTPESHKLMRLGEWAEDHAITVVNAASDASLDNPESNADLSYLTALANEALSKLPK